MHPFKALYILLCYKLYLTATQGMPVEIQNKIDSFIENTFLPHSGVSGLGLAVVKNDGEYLYTTGYGYADHEKRIQNGNRTQFLLGSVTKSFTALLIVKTLHENFPELGETVLDTPIKKLLPQANFTLMDRFRTEQATFRDLLSHKMCINRDDFQIMAEPFDSTAEIVYRQRYAEEMCGFRTRFMYNNHMVLLASELIGRLHNQTFEQVAKTFLKEIGMNDSTFVSKNDDESSLIFRAKPYFVLENKSHPMNPELIKRLSNIQAVGGLFVTPNDMSRFLRLQLNLGRIDGQQIVPEEVMSWLTKPSALYPKINFKTKSDDKLDTPLAYGLGLMIGSYEGWEMISHNGYFTPYRTDISWYPAHNIGIFSSTHEAPTLVKQPVLHAFILETLLGKEDAEKRAMKLLEGQKLKTEMVKTAKIKELERFLGLCKNSSRENREEKIIGKYVNDVTGDAIISRKYNAQLKQDKLYLKYGKWATGWLESVGGEVYRVIWDTDIGQDFYAGGAEDGSGLITVKENGLLEFLATTPHGMATLAQFKRRD